MFVVPGAKEIDLPAFLTQPWHTYITATLGGRAYIVLEAYAGISQQEEDIAL